MADVGSIVDWVVVEIECSLHSEIPCNIIVTRLLLLERILW